MYVLRHWPLSHLLSGTDLTVPDIDYTYTAFYKANKQPMRSLRRPELFRTNTSILSEISALVSSRTRLLECYCTGCCLAGGET